MPQSGQIASVAAVLVGVPSVMVTVDIVWPVGGASEEGTL
jgi:hypothetical protein